MAEANPLDNIIVQRPDSGSGKKAPPVKKTPKKASTEEAWIEYAKATGKAYSKEDKGYEDLVDYAKSAGKPVKETPIEELYDAHKHAGENPVMKEFSDRVREKEAEQKKINMEFQVETDAQQEKEQNLENLRLDFEAKRAQAARLDLDISGRWNKLKKALGFNSQEIKDSGVEQKMKEYKAAAKLYKDAKRKALGDDITKEQADDLLWEFGKGEALKFLEVKNDENLKIKKEKGEWPDNVANGYMNLVNRLRGMSMTKRIALSTALLGGGVLAGMTFGAVGAGVFSIAGAAYRVFSGGATGVGLKKLMDTVSTKKERSSSAKESSKILSQDDWLAQMDTKLDEALENLDSSIGKIEGKDLTRKRFAVWSGIFVGSGALAYVVQGAGFGRFVKDKLFGVGTAEASMLPNTEHFNRPPGPDFSIEPKAAAAGSYEPYHLPETDYTEMRAPDAGPKAAVFGEKYPEGKYGPAGTGTENEGHVNEFDEKYGPEKTGTENIGHEEIVKSTHERYGYGRYGAEGYATETEGHVNEFDEKYGPEKYGTEGKGHVNEFDERYGPEKTGTEGEGHINEFDEKFGPEKTGTENIGHVNEFDNRYGSEFHGTEAEGHLADFKEIATGNVKPGGSIEKISNNVLRAIKKDPSAFGLDPADPDFSEKANDMRKAMIKDFYTKKGFTSYEQFDSYVRRGPVQPGDKYWINWDPNEGKFRLGYEGKNMRPDVFQAASSEQVSSIEGGKIPEPQEAVRPKGGASSMAEHQPARPKGAGESIQYDQSDTPAQKIAKENWAKADDYAKRVAEWKAEVGPQVEGMGKAADLQRFVSTRGLFNRIVEGAGIGSRANFWETHAPDWYNQIMGPDYIADDVTQADTVDRLNGNRLRLKTLFEAFGKPEVGMSMNDYLAKIMSNSSNVERVNNIISGDLDELLRRIQK